jgi:hypothetical protein
MRGQALSSLADEAIMIAQQLEIEIMQPEAGASGSRESVSP